MQIITYRNRNRNIIVFLAVDLRPGSEISRRHDFLLSILFNLNRLWDNGYDSEFHDFVAMVGRREKDVSPGQ